MTAPGTLSGARLPRVSEPVIHGARWRYRGAWVGIVDLKSQPGRIGCSPDGWRSAPMFWSPEWFPVAFRPVLGSPALVVAAAPVQRPRPPKSFASRFWGALRAASGALGRRPRSFWNWAWWREFDAMCADHDRARAALGKPVGK